MSFKVFLGLFRYIKASMESLFIHEFYCLTLKILLSFFSIDFFYLSKNLIFKSLLFNLNLGAKKVGAIFNLVSYL